MDLKLTLNQIKSGEITDYPVNINQLTLPSNMKCEAIFDPYNQRIKFYGLTASGFDNKILEILKNTLSGSNTCFSKIIVYAHQGEENLWNKLNFIHEGVIRGFFNNHIDAHIWSLFLDPKRSVEHNKSICCAHIQLFNPDLATPPTLPVKYTNHAASPNDASEIASLLMSTFEDYPSPIVADHIKKCILNRTNHFRFIRNENKEIVAVMSAETDHKRSSAEMTDCATRPECQGQGLMRYLLYKLEQDLKTHFNITDFYTLARAVNPGITRVFLKSNYTYTGHLINNCRMPNGWETMNIWCKNT